MPFLSFVNYSLSLSLSLDSHFMREKSERIEDGERERESKNSEWKERGKENGMETRFVY